MNRPVLGVLIGGLLSPGAVGVMDDSEPPVITASQMPHWISRTAYPMAWVDAALVEAADARDAAPLTYWQRTFLHPSLAAHHARHHGHHALHDRAHLIHEPGALLWRHAHPALDPEPVDRDPVHVRSRSFRARWLRRPSRPWR